MLSITCKIIISNLSTNHMYIYSNRILNGEIQHYMSYSIFICLGVFLVITLKTKVAKIVSTIACSFIIIMIYGYTGGFWEPTKIYFEFQSPNNKTIIIEECSWLLGGWSNVYQKIDSNIIYRLDSDISTDDGYRPFSKDDYNLEWSTNSVNITYGFGTGGSLTSEVKFK